MPGRGIGERTIEHIRELAAERGGNVWEAIEAAAAGQGEIVAPRTRNALVGFAELVRRLRTRVGLLALPELLDLVLEESGYRAMLMDGSQEGEDRWANLLELREVVERYGDLEPGGRARPPAGGDGAGGRPGRLPGGRRRGHADHPPRRQGPRVRRRLHLGPGGGRLPARPGAGRSAPDGGGAAPRVRRPDAGPAPPVPDPRRAARDLGAGRVLRSVAVPAGDPGRADARPAAGGPGRGGRGPATGGRTAHRLRPLGRARTRRGERTPGRAPGPLIARAATAPAGRWLLAAARSAGAGGAVPDVARPRRAARGVLRPRSRLAPRRRVACPPTGRGGAETRAPSRPGRSSPESAATGTATACATARSATARS